MKLLLGGSDLAKLQQVRSRLLGMGVACDIVHQLDYDEPSGVPSYPELWVRKDEDYDTASFVLRRPGCVGTARKA